jgi:hypothetical protein
MLHHSHVLKFAPCTPVAFSLAFVAQFEKHQPTTNAKRITAFSKNEDVVGATNAQVYVNISKG